VYQRLRARIKRCSPVEGDALLVAYRDIVDLFPEVGRQELGKIVADKIIAGTQDGDV
jgi:hypothetical protein